MPLHDVCPDIGGEFTGFIDEQSRNVVNDWVTQTVIGTGTDQRIGIMYQIAARLGTDQNAFKLFKVERHVI